MFIKSSLGQGSSRPRRLDGLDERREVLEAGAGQEPAEELRRQDGEDAAGSRIRRPLAGMEFPRLLAVELFGGKTRGKGRVRRPCQGKYFSECVFPFREAAATRIKLTVPGHLKM